MATQGDLFAVYYFLYLENLKRKTIRYSRSYLRRKFKLYHVDAKNLLDFLEVKYVIRDWRKEEYPKNVGEQMTHPGDTVMNIIVDLIIKNFINSKNPIIRDIVSRANVADRKKKATILYNDGMAHYQRAPKLLDTMYQTLLNYLTQLVIFKSLHISPCSLDITSQKKTLKITGKIHPVYMRKGGKIPIRFWRRTAFEDKKMYSEATMMNNATIKGGIIFLPNNYHHGKHRIEAYYQLKGERGPNRWESYVSVNRNFKLKSTMKNNL